MLLGVTIAAAIAASIAAIYWFAPGNKPRGPARGNLIGRVEPEVPLKPGQMTLADVPLFEIPWKAEPDVDKILAEAGKNSPAPKIPAAAVPIAVAPKVEPKPVSPAVPAAKIPAPQVPPGPDFGASVMERKTAGKSADVPIDFEKLIAKAPAATPAPAIPVPVKLEPAPAKVENKNANASSYVPDFGSMAAVDPNKSIAALVPFGPNFKQSEAAKQVSLLKAQSSKMLEHIRQICANRTPTFEDWQNLCANKPAGSSKAEFPPIGSGRFIMSLCEDSSGRIWVGCEDEGVWCYDDQADADKQWQQFTRKNTGGRDEINDTTTVDAGNYLGDDSAYAIACDKLGRIWVGHLNHGVSVYNGREWRNYNIFDGPIGERVFAIAVCPTDGDVWIATSAGLTRYSLSRDRWFHYTRSSGLSSEQACALAFDKEGNIVVGTQSNGLALASSKDDYQAWTNIACDKEYEDRVPLTARGTGLPSNLINDIKISSDGTIYVATLAGLAWSKNKGASFEFLRGREWEEKVRGLYIQAFMAAKEVEPEIIPRSFGNSSYKQFSEDCLTAIAINNSNVWVGTRRGWIDCLQLSSSGISMTHGQLETASIRAIVFSSRAGSYAGQYGNGLVRLAAATQPKTVKAAATQGASVRMPSPIACPNSAELRELVAEVKQIQVSSSFKKPFVMALADDWMTRGQWLGRYGRYWMCLGAAVSPGDLIWGTGAENINYTINIGPHKQKGDSIRHWVHWNHTKHEGSLELPAPYLHSRVIKGLTTWEIDRRQSEWDDHSETYSTSFEGPDLYLDLNVPPGLFVLALYDVNKDGQSGVQEVRDFRISIKSPGSKDFRDAPELANGRIKDFWGGVYKRFLVRGPIDLTVKLERRYSFATILAAASLDKVEEKHSPYLESEEQEEKMVLARAARREASSAKATLGELLNVELDYADADPSEQLRVLLNLAGEFAPEWHARESRQYYLALARHYSALAPMKNSSEHAENALQLSHCFYQLNCFISWENKRRLLGLTTSREIEKSLRWKGNARILPTECRDLVRNYNSRKGL